MKWKIVDKEWFTLIYILAFLTISVKGANYTESLRHIDEPLYRHDRLISSPPNNLSALKVYFDGKVKLLYGNIPVFDFQTKNVDSVAPNTQGQLQFTRSEENGGTLTFGTGAMRCSKGKTILFTLKIDNALNLKVTSHCGTHWSNAINYLDFPYAAFVDITGMTINSFKSYNAMDPNAPKSGLGVDIYLLGSGFSADLDVSSHFLSLNTNETLWNTLSSDPRSNENQNNQIDYQDDLGHGTYLASISHSSYFGLTKYVNLKFIKIASSLPSFKSSSSSSPPVVLGHVERINQKPIQTEATYNERQFVEAVDKAVNAPTQKGNAKIIHFSGYFDTTNTNVVNCAIQWAYYQNIYFVSAAGDHNYNHVARNPYQLLVGSYDPVPMKSTSPKLSSSSTKGMRPRISDASAYGEGIDIWAPSTFLGDFMKGTGFASFYVTTALAIHISNAPNHLAQNVSKGYAHLLYHSGNQNLLEMNDEKSKRSSRSIGRTLFLPFFSLFNSTNLVIPLDYSHVPPNAEDYCGILQLNTKIPNWSSLIEKANASIFGRFL